MEDYEREHLLAILKQNILEAIDKRSEELLQESSPSATSVKRCILWATSACRCAVSDEIQRMK